MVATIVQTISSPITEVSFETNFITLKSASEFGVVVLSAMLLLSFGSYVLLFTLAMFKIVVFVIFTIVLIVKVTTWLTFNVLIFQTPVLGL